MDFKELKNLRAVVNHFIRVALSGKKNSPSAKELLNILNSKDVKERILTALNKIDILYQKFKIKNGKS